MVRFCQNINPFWSFHSSEVRKTSKILAFLAKKWQLVSLWNNRYLLFKKIFPIKNFPQKTGYFQVLKNENSSLILVARFWLNRCRELRTLFPFCSRMLNLKKSLKCLAEILTRNNVLFLPFRGKTTILIISSLFLKIYSSFLAC